MPPRYRFAPSPTGYFHVGGARTALYNWALAKQHGGTFVLRIEDTDEVRNHPEWTEGIVDGLAWLGIRAEDASFEGPYFQSSYAAAHVAAAERLYEQGLAYYCDLAPEQIEGAPRHAGSPDTTATRGTGGSVRDQAGCCDSGFPTEHGGRRRDPRCGDVREREPRRLRAVAGQWHAGVRARQCRR